MKAIIIDDEPLARSIVKEYLQYYPQIEVVQECNDAAGRIVKYIFQVPDKADGLIVRRGLFLLEETDKRNVHFSGPQRLRARLLPAS